MREGKQDDSEMSLTQTSKQVKAGKARISVRVVPASSPAHCDSDGDGDDNDHNIKAMCIGACRWKYDLEGRYEVSKQSRTAMSEPKMAKTNGKCYSILLFSLVLVHSVKQWHLRPARTPKHYLSEMCDLSLRHSLCAARTETNRSAETHGAGRSRAASSGRGSRHCP